MIHFTSDTHFGDPRALRIDRRPFSTLPAHDAGLIERWNEAVAPEDEVWHLERITDLLAALHGRKHLIVGNNDGEATLKAAGWASVQHYAELEVDGVRLVLCHYAFRTWNRMGSGVLNLHGHSHGRLKPMTRQHDVGVDAWDFRPVTLAHIRAKRRRAAVTRPAAAPTVAP